MSERKRLLTRKSRLPVLLASIGVGIVLISSGVSMVVNASRDAQLAAAITMTEQAALNPEQTPDLTPEAAETAELATAGATISSANPTPVEEETPTPTPVPARPVNMNLGAPTTESGEPASVPTPVPIAPMPDGVINVLMMGSDKRYDDPGFRTDVMIIVSVNVQENTVNMLSLPRDMFVYVPGWKFTKLNTAYAHGEAVGHPGGGFGLMQDTLLYNFGIRVDHYAIVDLNGFREIVDILGGVEVPVDCAIEGWMLEEPVLTVDDFDSYDDYVAYTADENNWIWGVVPVGMQELDGYHALWYARYRKGTSDFDRSIRQQQVLRAMVNSARENGLLTVTKIDQLWREYNELVLTDMGLGNFLQFLPVAANLDKVEVSSYFIADLLMITEADGYQGYIPVPENVEVMLERIGFAMQPPAQNYLISNSATVELRNGTTFERLDEVAVERLAWNGLNGTATGFGDATDYERTVIYDFTGRQKSSQLIQLQRLLHVADVNVIVQPDPNRTFDYLVILGSDFSTCTRNVPEVSGTPTGPGDLEPGTGDEENGD